MTPATDWTNPLTKRGYLNSPVVESDPFVFRDELYLLESWHSGWDWPGAPHEESGENREIWVTHLPEGTEQYGKREYLSRALSGHKFGTAIVSDGSLYVFATSEQDGTRGTVSMAHSTDLQTWSDPRQVFAGNYGRTFNTSVVKDEAGFTFLWEARNPGTQFTMSFGHLGELDETWDDNTVSGAHYGVQKYTGGPELLYEDGWYYLLYLAKTTPDGLPVDRVFETRIARSRNLVDWHDAPADRPVLTYDFEHRDIPLSPPPRVPDAETAHEVNASDPGITAHDGRVLVFFTGGNQLETGDLQWATFRGTQRELLESFFYRPDPGP